MPVFPLPIVLMPNSILPLHIFEMRYREMLDDIIKSDKCFVILNSTAEESAGSLGCIAQLIKVEKLADGRSNILTVGRERAKIVKYFSDKSYLTAEIEIVKDSNQRAGDSSLTALRSDLQHIVKLIHRLYKRDIESLLRTDIGAEELSFIVAGLLALEPSEQQRLIDINKTDERIKLLKPKIAALGKELAALAAIENAFAGDDK